MGPTRSAPSIMRTGIPTGKYSSSTYSFLPKQHPYQSINPSHPPSLLKHFSCPLITFFCTNTGPAPAPSSSKTASPASRARQASSSPFPPSAVARPTNSHTRPKSPSPTGPLDARVQSGSHSPTSSWCTLDHQMETRRRLPIRHGRRPLCIRGHGRVEICLRWSLVVMHRKGFTRLTILAWWVFDRVEDIEHE